MRKTAVWVSENELGEEMFELHVLLMIISTTCSHASKKKNLLTMKVLISMTELAAMTASRLMMLRTRMTLRTM